LDTIDDLQILELSTRKVSATHAPSRPRPNSILARLTKLALDIFQTETGGLENHSGSGYQTIVRDVAAIVLDESQEHITSITQDPLDPAFRSLFDLPDGTVQEWPDIFNEGNQMSYSTDDVWGL
jgi:energy-coupling factor transporter ATP-binding protein EcfA2